MRISANSVGMDFSDSLNRAIFGYRVQVANSLKRMVDSDNIYPETSLNAHVPMNSQMAFNFFLQLCEGLSADEAIRNVHPALKPLITWISQRDNDSETEVIFRSVIATLAIKG